VGSVTGQQRGPVFQLLVHLLALVAVGQGLAYGLREFPVVLARIQAAEPGDDSLDGVGFQGQGASITHCSAEHAAPAAAVCGAAAVALGVPELIKVVAPGADAGRSLAVNQRPGPAAPLAPGQRQMDGAPVDHAPDQPLHLRRPLGAPGGQEQRVLQEGRGQPALL